MGRFEVYEGVKPNDLADVLNSAATRGYLLVELIDHPAFDDNKGPMRFMVLVHNPTWVAPAVDEPTDGKE